ncbi:CDGP domain-containing protein [[Mycobacterium] crassicus]|uniref:CDGP domain-containing protein n=1 Tax=[Mycobacterium] crassicus TaxID=2872309 RepID=A0ABU5XER9_9MYCO|nr:hypothetical protein [Mycolicibacter sp. MYC098]MEB3020782.1 hypothetical protein [Mycolicibacter sp. MYC098]
MSPAFRYRWMPAAVAACGVVAAGIVASGSPAGAVPPPKGCATEPFGMLCDSPIGSDNTFMRCRISRGMLGARGLYLPATEKCWVVDLGKADPIYGNDLPHQHL